ncbi:hypothetical protein [Lactiplantibacillus plantarum]|uniref:hypothetical protein n=1 Tax=Lactiplantibacillus plantarum TaxID=1590 RepID=UPI0029A28C3C|nr:hypothetical protein [Lactiplantibacillus plantarum]MDX3785525.1 hypothetical protein [Lactiplantibacillus plantarum]MDX3811397.1 hypothetical protein [Lactiplantibacillus plantarum]MDX3856411.1 hypothetical protein [Lactiplantibacillus plantarum]
MPLFGKSEAKKNLIESVGSTPEGYHSTGIIQTMSSGHVSPLIQSKLIKDLENICIAAEAAGFCNYRITSHFDSVGSKDILFAYADMIKKD